MRIQTVNMAEDGPQLVSGLCWHTECQTASLQVLEKVMAAASDDMLTITIVLGCHKIVRPE